MRAHQFDAVFGISITGEGPTAVVGYPNDLLIPAGLATGKRCAADDLQLVVGVGSQSRIKFALAGIYFGERWHILDSETVGVGSHFPGQGVAIFGNHIEKPGGHMGKG